MLLSNDEYEEMVFQLLKTGEPFTLLVDLEREHLPDNPAFHDNLNLYFIAANFNDLLSQKEKKDSVKIMQYIKERKTTVDLDRKIPSDMFNINELFFFDKAIETTIPEGKIAAPLCCKRTIGIFEGLKKFHLTKDEYDLFIHSFRNHPFSREYKNESDKEFVIDSIFEQAGLLRLDLQEYFLDSMRTDMVAQFVDAVPLKLRFQKQFDERLKMQRPTVEDLINGDSDSDKEEFTTPRQVLAMHFLLEYSNVRGIDQVHKARFIEFLTGKNYKNIYDLVRSPLATKTGNFRREDLQFIRPYFENLGLTEIVKMINNQLDKPDV